MIRFIFLGLVFTLFYGNVDAQNMKFEAMPLSLEKQLTTIAFGSCNNQKKEQTMWPFIAADKPDLWIWSGDIVKQKVNPAYQRFLAQVPVIGTWDDHDYGDNDACKTYPKRVESKALLLDFLDVDESRPVYKRNGAYQSYTFGPQGQRVKIILLDTRYFRDELEPNPEKGGARYLKNRAGDVLGFDQWKWLENQLTDSSADVHIIVTSIQLISMEHDYEKWSNFPAARHKFFKLMEKTNPANPILISGDRHIAEISMIEVPNIEVPLYEITSSGLTHTWKTLREEANQYRVGDLGAKLNYGILHIDWSGDKPKLTAEIKGEDSVLLQQCQLE